MVSLDTNVLIRYFTRDDEQQWQQATKLIENEQQCFVTNIVLCELVWVLRGEPYRFSRDEILNILVTMLHSQIFEFEDRSAVYQALQRTRHGSGDFSDYLIGAIARQQGFQETATFDRKLKSEKGFRFLA